MYFNEWQLWIHPYPTLIKTRGRRINPGLYLFSRAFHDGDIVNVSEMIEERKRTPAQLKMCVRAIALKELEKKDSPENDDVRSALSKGFAICTAQLQKHGYLKLGSQAPTKAGKSAARSKAATKGYDSKLFDYEELLAAARKMKKNTN